MDTCSPRRAESAANRSRNQAAPAGTDADGFASTAPDAAGSLLCVESALTVAEWGVQFIDGQWELSIRVVDDGLRVSIIDGPDQAGITLPMGSAIDLAHFFAAWRAAADRG